MITVDKEKLIVTLQKPSFTYEDTQLFRMYGFAWSPDGNVKIPIRGTAKKALWSTIKQLYPSFKTWEKKETDRIINEIKEAFTIYEEGFDAAVAEKAPLYKFLFAHQKECVRAQCYKKYNLISLEQGLGKTMSSLVPSFILDTPITLIIVPNSLKYNWKEEMTSTWQERFGWSVPENQITILNSNKSHFARDQRFIIINYDIVDKYLEHLLSLDIKRIIIDECHYIKNRDAQRTKTIKTLIFKLRASVSFLGGTPAPNRITDIFSYLEMSRHPEGEKYSWFTKKYCVMQKTQYGEKAQEGINLGELNRNIQNFMIRKLKTDCLDLPEKNYIKINFENEEYDAIYETAYKELLQKIMNSGGKRSADIESQMNTLQIITAKAKVKPCIELCENIMSDIHIKDGREYPKKVAIMCNFKEPLFMLQDYFKEKCVMIYGGVDSEKRMELVNAFRKIDDIQVFLGQTTSAGVGLNMTECADVIFLNFPYTRAEIEQAADRFHRIGQKEQVSVYFTVLRGKIDEQIYKILKSKYRHVSQLIDSKVDNTETVDVGDNFIGDMFEQMKADILSTNLTHSV